MTIDKLKKKFNNVSNLLKVINEITDMELTGILGMNCLTRTYINGVLDTYHVSFGRGLQIVKETALWKGTNNWLETMEKK